MSRRNNGEGSIYKLADGTYRVAVSSLEHGRMRRVSRRCKTRSEAAAILQELRSAGVPKTLPRTSQTVGGYLAWWLDVVVAPSTAAATLASRRNAVSTHILPRIGLTPLRKLDAASVQTFVSDLAEAKIGGRTQQIVLNTLRQAMAYAVAPLAWLRANPCEGVSTPKHREKDIHPFEAAEVGRILAAVKETRWYAPILLAFGTGLRQGELFALEWNDIDWNRSLLKVLRQVTETSGHKTVKPPKTSHSRRTVPLPQMAIDALAAHRLELEASDLAGSHLCFPAAEGGLVARGNFRARVWVPLLKKLKLTHRGFHHTRHTYATLSLSNGAPLPVVSRCLGHANQSITVKIYSHYLPSQEFAVANTIDRLLN